ncbi:PRD domain-containing protein [Virgibacillus halophilus]|uniref:PRD domain-containing protein n=1 Tax=Tigheibacillus halophilus TaxID=361280 RepID=UPI00362B44B1
MLVKKKINNNFALCVDSNSQELIAYGLGIGFGKIPYELTDLSKIERTFYNVDSQMYFLVGNISDDIFKISSRIVDLANAYLNESLSQNLVFSLADHIQFAIERKKRGIFVKNPLGRDVEYLYKKEMQVGRIARQLISDELNILLPREEEANIAVHFIMAETNIDNVQELEKTEGIIDNVANIIEKELNFKINKESTQYTRFLVHLEYLFKRISQQDKARKSKSKMYAITKSEYPAVNNAVLLLEEYLHSEYRQHLNEDELLYLLLHINRLFNAEN